MLARGSLVGYLARANALPSDQTLRFAEEGHQYSALSPHTGEWVSSRDGRGMAPLISVTTILGRYFPGVDFARLARRIWTGQRAAILTDPDNKYHGCRSPEDIASIWGRGATLGTEMHARFEELGNEAERVRGSGGDVLPELQFEERPYYEAFVDAFGLREGGPLRFFRTEFVMWHSDLHVSGMIDAVLHDTRDDSYIIVDYKRVKGGVKGDPVNPRKPVHELAPGSRGRTLPGFLALRNNAFNKYGCQLTLYKRLFEHMLPGRRVSGLYLIVVDSLKLGQRDALKITEVPVNKFDACVDEVFAARAQEMLSPATAPPHADALRAYLSRPVRAALREDAQEAARAAMEVESQTHRILRVPRRPAYRVPSSPDPFEDEMNGTQ